MISVRGAREHNLRNVDIDLPRDRLVVITGLSGSGKSSLAFDTIYAEGQRRYVESLSSYARQFLGQMDKPDVDFIEGLSPAISIDQKSAGRNPRSTVGTITEIYDYLRLLYARIGIPHCPTCGRAHHAPDAATDRRPRARASRGHPLPGTRTRRARSQGRVRRVARRTRAARLHPRPHRRRDHRTRRPRRGSPRPVREPHHRGRGRPPGAPAGHRTAADRLAGDRPAVGRRRGRGRDRRARKTQRKIKPRCPARRGRPRRPTPKDPRCSPSPSTSRVRTAG